MGQTKPIAILTVASEPPGCDYSVHSPAFLTHMASFDFTEGL